jgi:hypothetical protein
MRRHASFLGPRRGLLLALLCAAPALAATTINGPSRVDLAADATPEGLTAVTVVNPAGLEPKGFALAHQLGNAAAEGRAQVRRQHWGDLAAAYASVPVTGDAAAERRLVGRHEVLIRKIDGGDGTLRTTFYLPAELLMPTAGKWTLALESSPSRTRNATTELTTFPLRASLGYASQPTESRSVEGKLALARTYISRKQRVSVRDADGNLISFHDLDAETVQDSQEAGLDLGSYWTVGRSTRLGQVEMGLTLGGAWQQDEINLLDRRTTAYVGGELRVTSETIDGLTASTSLRLGGSDEVYLIIDPLYDASGAVVGTTESTERHRLPTWEVLLSGTAPLYRLNGITLASVEAKASFLRSFERSDPTAEAPATTEQRVVVELGVAIQLPIGAKVGLRGRLETLDLPGEAGRRVDDVQWASGMTAGMTLRF